LVNQLGTIVVRPDAVVAAFNFDTPGFELLRHFADKFDRQEAVLKIGGRYC
jgi:hypothetical protein